MLVRVRVLLNVRVGLSHIWDWGVYNWYQRQPSWLHVRVRARDTDMWRMARVDPCVVARHGICASSRRRVLRGKVPGRLPQCVRVYCRT